MTTAHLPALDRLKAQRPAETMNRLAASLKSKHGVAVGISPRAGMAAEISITVGAKANLPAALRAVEMSLTSLPHDECRIALTELDSITARKSTDSTDLSVQLGAMARRLGAYPADVVLCVVRDWDRTWFPAWAELQAKLDRETQPRRALASKLRRAIDGKPDHSQYSASNPRGLNRVSSKRASEIMREAGFAE